jgi:hypothetical protein
LNEAELSPEHEERALDSQSDQRQLETPASSRNNKSHWRLLSLLRALAEKSALRFELPRSLQMFSPDKSFLFVHSGLAAFIMVRCMNDRIRTLGRSVYIERVRDDGRNCRSTANNGQQAVPSRESSDFSTHHSGLYDLPQVSIECSVHS